MIPATSVTARLARLLVYAVLIAVPFYAFLTVFGASILGHYTALRLWDDFFLLILSGICLVWLARDRQLLGYYSRLLVFRLIALYIALNLLLAAVAYVRGDVTPKALGYGLLSDLRYPVWLLAVTIAARKAQLHFRWRYLIVPAAVVVVFGALQFLILPHNFLVHFGYHAGTTIAPIETINHNNHYIRVQSTLRGANPLGAYLVIVVAAMAAGARRYGRQSLYWLLGLLTLLCLYASGSRSAWIGSLLALLVVLWLQVRSRRAKLLLGNGFIAALVIIAGLALLFRNNTGLQNALLHTQKHSAVATGSNSAHASALKNGVEDVVRQPFGDGPGTAGPASVYNAPHQTRIAEDYYVQIAQETGWIGLGLFLAILYVVGRTLYVRSARSPLALMLFASLLGISFVNLLSHAWADDTLTFVWWGLAGLAIGPLPERSAATDV